MSNFLVEASADVTGTLARVEVQMPDGRVHVLFGQYGDSVLELWLSDPAEIADLADKLNTAGQQLTRELSEAGHDR